MLHLGSSLTWLMISPSGGENKCPTSWYAVSHIIPVRGRKLIRLSSTIILYECMLPVKGRKLLNFTLDISPSCITTYPRKGAITITCYLQIFKCSYDPRKGARTLSPSGCNVSVLYDPRKGAKLLSQVAKPNNDKCDPRKGTKNSASEKMRNFSFVQP